MGNYSINFQKVTHPNGVVIQWDGIKAAKITLPDDYPKEVCGLCGNKDGIPDFDKYKMGAHVKSNGASCIKKAPDGNWGDMVCILILDE